MSITAPTYEEFIASFPAFADTDETVVELQLSLSIRLLDQDAWEDFYSDAVGLDTAHNLTLSLLSSNNANGALQGTSGPITSSSGAGLSISYASPEWNKESMSDSWYIKTTYGQLFMQLRNRVFPVGVLCA